jgi:hypothetical protein
VAVVEPLGIPIVLSRDPVEADVTARRSVSQAGIEERGARAVTSEGRVDEEVVHDKDAISDQGVDTGIQAGETLKLPVRLGYQLHPEIGIPFEQIEQGLDLLPGKRGAVEGEVALDQGKKPGAILTFGRTNEHRASLASV